MKQRLSLLLLGLLLVSPILVFAQEYLAPDASSNVVFFENFNTNPFGRWVLSDNEEFTGTWKWSEAEVVVGEQGDKGLVANDAHRRHAISSRITPPLDADNKDIVIQYEVKTQNPLMCSGAYIKLLAETPSLDLSSFGSDTPYIIMFGPDKCGSSKVHFIFRHQNPITKEWEEKHLSNPPSAKEDKKSHLYTLIVRPDNTFEIKIDNESVRAGSLLLDFTPSVNPPKEIDDPSDKKPLDWVDEASIPDPEAKKPADWDEEAPLEIEDETDVKPKGWLDNEPEYIADPNAEKPEDWDEEEDGQWEAELIPNPKCDSAPGCGRWSPRRIPNPAYKGKWAAPLIDNPAFKGVWAPRKIANPAYFEDKNPHNFPKIGAVGIEILANEPKILFDNFFIGHDVDAAAAYAEQTWRPKFDKETQLEPEVDPLAQQIKDAQSGSFMDTIFNAVQMLINEYPIPTLSTVAVMALSLPFLLFRGSGKKKEEVKEEAEAEEKPEEAAAAVVAEEKKKEEENKTKDEGMRKRAATKAAVRVAEEESSSASSSSESAPAAPAAPVVKEKKKKVAKD